MKTEECTHEKQDTGRGRWRQYHLWDREINADTTVQTDIVQRTL